MFRPVVNKKIGNSLEIILSEIIVHRIVLSSCRLILQHICLMFLHFHCKIFNFYLFYCFRVDSFSNNIWFNWHLLLSHLYPLHKNI